jgi:SPP1 gp7 family putative phage head morphogenesis protein
MTPITTAELLATHPEPKVGQAPLPMSVGITYNVELQNLVNAIKRDINEQLIPALRAEQSNYTADSGVVERTINEYIIVTPRLYDAYTRDSNDVYVTDTEVVLYASTRYTADSTWFDRLAAILRRIRARYESPQFKALSDTVARQFVNAVDGRTQKNLGIDVYGNDENLQTVIEASIFDNTRLIKSIPEQYLAQVESIVVTNTRAGNRSSTIAAQLSEQFGVTQRRAKFIARDQTAKVNSAIAQKRIEAAGYEFFQWRTSRDNRVRDRHKDIAEKVTEYGKGIYRYDNPPLSDKGVPILPGVDYGCRCTQRPVSRREVERNKERGLTRPGVKR